METMSQTTQTPTFAEAAEAAPASHRRLLVDHDGGRAGLGVSLAERRIR